MPDFHAGHMPLTPHGIATALSDIRREIARLQRQEARLLDDAPARPGQRPGWPMQRLAAQPLALPAPVQTPPQTMGARTSTSSPSRTAV